MASVWDESAFFRNEIMNGEMKVHIFIGNTLSIYIFINTFTHTHVFATTTQPV